MKKAPQRHHDRCTRLASPRVTVDQAEIVLATTIVIEMASDAAMGHLGVLEGILGQPGRNSLRGCEKVGIKEPQK